MTTTKILGVCPHDCPDTCGVITEVENNTAVKFYADPNHPITQGWLCNKVRPYLDHIYHPDRLTTPLRRAGKKPTAHWQPITWAEAISEIGDRWRTIIDQYGAEAILPYSYSGTLGLVQNVITSTRFWNRLGASQLNRAICGEAAATAVTATLGVRHGVPYEDVLHSKTVIIWGHNPITTAPHFMPFLRKAQRNGTQLIVIDPRRTRTAQGADLHVAPLPATDGALALGMAHLIVRQGWHNETWLNNHTIGWPAFKDRLADYPPERVAHITGLPIETIETLAHVYAKFPPVLIKIADGLQRHPNGGQTIRAILTLPALTAQYGIKGGGIGYSTSGVTQWHEDTLQKWAECPPPGRWVNMNRLGTALVGEVTDPPIQSLFVFCANPATVNPNAGQVIAGLQRPDLFTVVHDLFLTDTADYADIVLPATSQLEQADLHKAYGHTLLAYNAPAIPPLGESKSNWEVMQLLATEMGFTDSWLHESVDTIITDLLKNSLPQNPHLEGITLDRLKAEGAIPYNLPHTTPFADGHFPTPSGKVELYCEALTAEGVDALPAFHPATDPHPTYPADQALNLITGASHHFVTSSLGNHPNSVKNAGIPFLEINPHDARQRGIQTGDTVKVENSRGYCHLETKVTDAVRRGVVVSPKGYWLKHHQGRNVNFTTSDALGDLAGQSTFHTNSVWLSKVEKS